MRLLFARRIEEEEDRRGDGRRTVAFLRLATDASICVVEFRRKLLTRCGILKSGGGERRGEREEEGGGGVSRRLADNGS